MAEVEDTKSFPFLDAMPRVLRAALDLMVSKGRTYGDSWKARGGRGAWYTLVRPMDRLQLMVERDHAGDIFAGVEAEPLGGDGTVLDALRDLRNYLSLVEAELVARGVVALPYLPADSAIVSEKPISEQMRDQFAAWFGKKITNVAMSEDRGTGEGSVLLSLRPVQDRSDMEPPYPGRVAIEAMNLGTSPRNEWDREPRARGRLESATLAPPTVLETGEETCHDMGQSTENWYRGLRRLFMREQSYTANEKYVTDKIHDLLDDYCRDRSKSATISSRALVDGTIQIDIRVP